MRIRELISEAKFSSPIIAYHGSTGDNLSSILSDGLLLDKSGGGWGSSITGSARQRSMNALPGVYLSRKITTAVLASMYHQGKKLLVILQVQPRSMVIDEDEIANIIEQVITQVVEDEGSTADYYERFMKSPREEIRGFMYDVPAKIQDLLSRNRNMAKIVFKAIRYNLERELSYQGSEEISDSNLKNNIPDSQTAEINYRKILDRMTSSLKRLGYGDDQTEDSLRMKGDIKFHGKNRILCILSYDSFDDFEFKIELNQIILMRK